MRRLYARRERGLKSMTIGPVKRLLSTFSRVFSVSEASSLYCFVYVCEMFVCVRERQVSSEFVCACNAGKFGVCVCEYACVCMLIRQA